MSAIKTAVHFGAAVVAIMACGGRACPQPKDEITALIEKLPDIAEGDVGYMPTRSGGGFLPLDVSEPGAMLLFQNLPAKSEALRELVKRGAAAVPQLVAHLDDKRPTKIELKHEG